MKKTISTFILIFFLIFIKSFAQEPTSKLSSYEGLHFMVSFMQNEYDIIDSKVDLKIFIATQETANIVIKYPNLNPKHIVLSPDTLHVESVDNLYEYRGNSELIRKIGIMIHSDVPITVYAFSSQTKTSDCYTAIPIKNWGTEYIAICQPVSKTTEQLPSGVNIDVIRESEFMVLAAYDSTVVTINPSDITGAGKPANKPFSVTLNIGETFLVKSLYQVASDGDLTGSIISSNKPVGVLSGHVRAPIPARTNTRDHLVEMLTPTHSWGKQFVSVPFDVSKYGDIFRVVAKTIPTIVELQIDSVITKHTIDNAKGYIEIEGITKPTIWTSDNPVEIAQFMGHVKVDNEDSRYFDPCMALVPPKEQFVRHVMFQTPGNIFQNPNQYQHHYTSIALEKSAKSFLRLDGKRLDSAGLAVFQPIKNSNLLWTRIELEQGTHVLESTTGSFSGVLFATGLYDSYALVLGASLKIPGVVDSLPPNIKINENCGELNIEVKDIGEDYTSGLLYAQVNKFRSYNFDWEVKPFEYSDSIAYISAKVTNPFVHGKLVIYAQDKDGNKSEKEFYYYRTDIKLPTDFNFGIVNWNDSTCKSKSLINYSNKPYKILSARIENDKRLKLYTDKSLPTTLDKGGVLAFNICFKPAYDSTEVKSKLIIEMDCGKTDTIDISALVRAPDLMAIGKDYGDLLAGESIQGEIKILNQGNIEIVIDTLITTGDESQFTFNRNIFPFPVAAGSEYKIPASFTPTTRGNFKMQGEFKNSADLDNSFILEGRALAPIFENIIIDFKKVRVGHFKDTIIYVVNNGDYNGDLSFNKFLQKSFDDTSSKFLSGINSTNIVPTTSIELKAPIQVQNVGAYYLSSEMLTNCKVHPPVKIEIYAEGTLPICKTEYINFADTDIYSETDSNAVVIKSLGNEELSVRSVTAIEPIIPEFEYDLASLQGIKILVGESAKLNISFMPTKGGVYEQKFLVKSDAAPDYGEKLDTITIRAKAIVPDIEKIAIDFSAKEFVNCQTNILNVKITNKGTKTINLDSIFVSAIPQNLTWKVLNDFKKDLTYVLNPNEEYNFSIEIYPLSGTKSTIKVEAIIFNSEKISAEYDFTPKQEAATIFSIQNLDFEIGKEYNLSFSGSVPYAIEKGVEIVFEINLPSDAFYIDTTKQINLVFEYGLTCPLKISRLDDKFILTADKVLPLKESNWKIEFQTLCLMEKSSQFNLTASINFDDCYLNSAKNFIATFAEICTKELRLIKINSNLLGMRILPNPIKNELNIDIDLPEDAVCDINLYDIEGKKINLSEKLVLQKGKHLLIYNFIGVPNGIYYLELSSERYLKRTLIIINK